MGLFDNGSEHYLFSHRKHKKHLLSLLCFTSFLSFQQIQAMVKKTSPRPRLVVYVSDKEASVIQREAIRLGIKNGHRWASMKLAPAIRELSERAK